MKKPLFISLVIVVLFAACKKENSDNNPNPATNVLSGNWTFTGIHAATSATLRDVGDGVNEKIITTSDYSTSGNGGTVAISGHSMTGTGITYSANILALISEYEDDVLIDTFSTVLPFTISPMNSTTTFEVIGQDSIHYTGGSMFAAGNGAPAATGARFSISGNILTLTSNVLKDSVTDLGGGETASQHETAVVIATLQKND